MRRLGFAAGRGCCLGSAIEQFNRASEMPVDSTFKLCAVAFAFDLPHHRRPVSAALNELVAGFSPPSPTWRDDLNETLRKMDAAALIKLDAEFQTVFPDEVAAAEEELDRVGAEDHFLFEYRVRRTRLLNALVAGREAEARASFSGITGTASPMYRQFGRSAADTIWPALELLAQASLNKSHEALEAARKMRSRLPAIRRPYFAELEPVFTTLRKQLRSVPREPAAPTSAALRFQVLPAFAGVSPLVGNGTGNIAAGDVVTVRAANVMQAVVYLVDPRSSTPTPYATVNQPEMIPIYVAALSDSSPEVDLIIEVRRGTALIGSATVTIETSAPASPRAATAAAGPAAPNAAPAAPAPRVESPKVLAARARAAAITSDAQLCKALELLFLYSAISEHDLRKIGGFAFMLKFTISIEHLAKAGGFRYELIISPDGKVYQMRSS